MFAKYLKSVMEGQFLNLFEAYHVAEILLNDSVSDAQKAAF